MLSRARLGLAALLALALFAGPLVFAQGSEQIRSERMQAAVRAQAPVAIAAPLAELSYHHDVDFAAVTDAGKITVTQTLDNLPAALGKTVTLRMPNWTPGAYGMHNAGRRVEGLTATAGDTTLGVAHPALDTWRITRGEATRVSVRYTVPVGRRGRWRARGGVHYTGPNVYLYLEGHERKGAHTVTFSGLPEGWTISTGLPIVDRKTHRYRAPDYDALIDCPVTAGKLFSDTIMVKGCPIELTYLGSREMAERMNEKLKPGIAKIVAWQLDLFGEIPFPRYVFQFTVRTQGSGSGGLEHRNSTEISLTPGAVFTSKAGLSVIAHEFFHLWNVKRIRSRKINPFDYRQTPKMDSLWFHEGVTSYYAAVCNFRAGITTEAEFLASMGRSWARCNNTGDYYTRGTAWGFAMDLEIRRLTEGRRSFDDVMRAMNWLYARPDVGFNESAGILDVVNAVAQADLKSVWLPIVLGRTKADFAKAAPVGGLRFVVGKEQRQPYFGVQANPAEDGRGVMLDRVIAKSSASRAGFKNGDRLLTLNGVTLTANNWRQTIRECPLDRKISATYERAGERHAIEFEIGWRSNSQGTLEKDAKASPEAVAVYAGFCAERPFRRAPARGPHTDTPKPAQPRGEEF